MIIATVLFASSYSLTKIALEGIPPITLGFVRFALAAALMVLATRGLRRRPDRATARALALAGLLGVTAYFTLENLGVHLATATDAALLVAAYPVFTAALDALVTGHRPPRRLVGGIALTGVGVVAIVMGSGFAEGGFSGDRLVGDAILVVTGLAWAAYTLISRRSVSDRPVVEVVTWQNVYGAIGFLPLLLLEASRWRMPEDPAATVLAVAGLVLGCSIAAMVAYNKALTRLEPATAVNALNLVPLWGVLIATAVLGERITTLHIIGGLVVILGVLLTTLPRSGRGATATAGKSAAPGIR